MGHDISALEKARAAYQPRLPKVLRQADIRTESGLPTEAASDGEQIRALFPNTYGQPIVTLVQGESDLRTDALRVGVVLSGGPAAGGHNVIAGLFDALRAANGDSRLFGFLRGPRGIIDGDHKELTSATVDAYRNTGGFDMIMSGRDKIEKPDDLARCRQNLEEMDLDGLVIVGGDDSNTNAAVLSEYLLSHAAKTCVVGVPKTVDGDMRSERIEITFGYDTACRVYSELIGNVCRDAISSVKYWHFIKLMGRSASHITLECAMQTHPNIALISEEIKASGATLEQIVDGMVDVVVKRAEAGRDYGVVIVPEGLPEFISDIKAMIDELSAILGEEEGYIQGLPDHSERVQHLSSRLTDHSARVYGSLPEDTQEVLLWRDSHGNVPLSQVETERLLIDLVSDKIRQINARGGKKITFRPLSHFFGYEGRCAAPSNFDADYAYSLGYTAAQLIRANLTGYTAGIQHVTWPPDEWIACGTPITMMLCMEMRKGKPAPVIGKALVDLAGAYFRRFADKRESWALNDDYVFPGPVQYFGPPEVCDAPPLTLALQHARRVRKRA
jgi:pyrophosphate--fructose-6-phosphate 1-phosphotransferase